MDEQQFLDFLSAWGEELCTALSPLIDWESITPQEAYEVFVRAFGQDPSPRLLASFTTAQMEQLRATCESYFGVNTISAYHVRDAIARTLLRWPVDDGQ